MNAVDICQLKNTKIMRNFILQSVVIILFFHGNAYCADLSDVTGAATTITTALTPGIDISDGPSADDIDQEARDKVNEPSPPPPPLNPPTDINPKFFEKPIKESFLEGIMNKIKSSLSF